MVLRLLGLKKEATYGKLAGEDVEGFNLAAVDPDVHRRIGDGNFKLNDEPKTFNEGSRMIQGARAGAMKPTGSTSGKCDLTRITHYLHALFDEYECDSGTTISGTKYYTHEFWGGEGHYLNSFHAWATYDIFQKHIVGLMLESLKLEVSDDFMTQSEEWVYQTETREAIDEDEYDIIEVENEIPLMFYDITVLLGTSDITHGTSSRVYTSLSFEAKNNFNQDGTVGLGSRGPQRQAAAQGREINLSLSTYLSPNTLSLINAAEYGYTSIDAPSGCHVLEAPLKIIIRTCENSHEYLEMYFPSCIIDVEYSYSEAEEIETTFNLISLGTKTATKVDGDIIRTDAYMKLVNTVPAITSAIA
ncbi:MAG: carboxypeptidase regulatory-like domain-containing protein [Methanobrevibacter sp.]|nr:carboxypeptidase regulatory-like domain-containing protein [Methanobrevibacter sp.]